MDNLSGQKEETFWDELVWALDNVADSWVVMMGGIADVSVKVAALLLWLSIILVSPVWVGPYLLWRKRREKE